MRTAGFSTGVCIGSCHTSVAILLKGGMNALVECWALRDAYSCSGPSRCEHVASHQWCPSQRSTLQYAKRCVARRAVRGSAGPHFALFTRPVVFVIAVRLHV